jgi:hypothetical protein
MEAEIRDADKRLAAVNAKLADLQSGRKPVSTSACLRQRRLLWWLSSWLRSAESFFSALSEGSGMLIGRSKQRVVDRRLSPAALRMRRGKRER